MRTFERTVLIITLLIAVAALLTGRGQSFVSAAFAQDMGGDAMEEETAGDSPEARDASETGGAIAYVEGYSLLTDLLASDRFQPAIDELQAEAEEALAPFQTQIEELRGEFQSIAPDDQQAQQEIQARFQQIQQEAQAVQQEYQERIEALQRENVQKAFEDLRAAAEAVADERGYTYVMMAEDPSDNVNEGLTQDPSEEIRRRFVLVHPDGANITEDVRADLNLD